MNRLQLKTLQVRLSVWLFLKYLNILLLVNCYAKFFGLAIKSIWLLKTNMDTVQFLPRDAMLARY